MKKILLSLSLFLISCSSQRTEFLMYGTVKDCNSTNQNITVLASDNKIVFLDIVGPMPGCSVYSSGNTFEFLYHFSDNNYVRIDDVRQSND